MEKVTLSLGTIQHVYDYLAAQPFKDSNRICFAIEEECKKVDIEGGQEHIDIPVPLSNEIISFINEQPYRSVFELARKYQKEILESVKAHQAKIQEEQKLKSEDKVEESEETVLADETVLDEKPE